jgi:hypothetical protein
LPASRSPSCRPTLEGDAADLSTGIETRWYATHLFHQRYVITDVFDQALYSLAQRAQKVREQGDYEAVTPGADEAKAIVGGAADFVAAVERMLEG